MPELPEVEALAGFLAEPPATGFDLTEAGTKKRLAVYVVLDPSAVPGALSKCICQMLRC